MSNPIENWIQDGTLNTEPVTTETPAETAAAPSPAPEAPAPEPAAEATPPAGDEPASASQHAAAAAVAAETGATPPAPGASAQEVQDFIEAQLGEGTFKIPRGVRLPLKVQGETHYATLDELLKGGMMERDYRLKTAEAARLRREAEDLRTQLAAEQAKLAAREKWLREQEAELRAAQTDPEKWQAYQEHLRQYQINPHYRRMVDASLRQQETEAELAIYRQREDAAIVQRGVETVEGWIAELSQDPRFAAVDPERVRQLYGQRLAAGQANLDPADVRAIFESEADYLAKSVTPLQQQLANLKAEIEAIRASQAAEKQNQTTRHALNRAKAVPVATGAAAPAPGPRPQPQRFGINELPDRIAAWVRERD